MRMIATSQPKSAPSNPPSNMDTMWCLTFASRCCMWWRHCFNDTSNWCRRSSAVRARCSTTRSRFCCSSNCLRSSWTISLATSRWCISSASIMVAMSEVFESENALPYSTSIRLR
ncbi:hypothetical protein H257_17595 [Aphanomyces astaci]|uniref:Uncharacterized protein n=1 Tax=Aphanomyces astaci TaxID=112090 RepID=W4FE77_APHAT|nr:hypothetical protein H257_17595 [Aphanomyces astaci]ETV65785.1 hypothetical protein H257_17595 [Aphanomyces astaci]|eukprot:XP_009844760.1 hypothetical protein H257_17595 [Aphanomyces astaci]